MTIRIYDTIASAIESRKILSFNYEGGQRFVEPYCYGRNHKGNELLRAYQIRGFSRSDTPTGWKLFRVDKISNLKADNTAFGGLRPRYNPNDSAMEIVYCRI